ncbi:MAG: hypothetical protein MI742_16425 [Desulfobacterales bacterium]|nr:hypothetical protein [Desulfobacterales bacterium]
MSVEKSMRADYAASPKSPFASCSQMGLVFLRIYHMSWQRSGEKSRVLGVVVPKISFFESITLGFAALSC